MADFTQNIGVARKHYSQEAIAPERVDRMIKRGLGDDITYLESLLTRESPRGQILDKITSATDNVIEKLNKITKPKSTYIFSGNSTGISATLISSRKVTLAKYPVVVESLEHSIYLNSDKNMDFRDRAYLPYLHPHSVVIDEFAEHMLKARQLLLGITKPRKMVVFSAESEPFMTAQATSYFNGLIDRKLFIGLRDHQLTQFMSCLAHTVSTVIDIKYGFGVSKDEDLKLVRWDISKLTESQLKVLERGENAWNIWKELLVNKLGK